MQQQIQFQSPFHCLDLAAQQITTILASANIRHGFIGGYATSLIGGSRMTTDLDIVVDAEPSFARNLMLQANAGFEVSSSNKLTFVSGGNWTFPIIDPSVLILTKVKRWSFLADSTRPQSVSKAAGDVQDMEVMLRWLVQKGHHVNFEGYPEKPKKELLDGMRKLHRMHAHLRPLIQAAVRAQDMA